MEGSDDLKLYFIQCPDCGLFRVDEMKKSFEEWNCLRCGHKLEIEEVPQEDIEVWRLHDSPRS